MDRRIVLTKTAKGLREASGNTSRLAKELRSVLAQIDGRATVGDIQKKLERIPEGKLLSHLARLSAEGYVREFVSAPNSFSPDSVLDDGPIGDLDFMSLAAAESRLKSQERRDAEEASDVARLIATSRAGAAGGAGQATAPAARQADVLIRHQQEAAIRAQQEAALRAQQEAALRAQQEAALRAQQEAALRAQHEAALRAQHEAALRAQQEAARRAAEEAARVAAEEVARRVAAEAKRLADEQAKALAEAQRRAEAAEQLRLEAERRAQEEAERRLAEIRHREEVERRLAEEESRRKAQAEAQERLERERAAETIRREEELRRREEAARIEAEELVRREVEEAARRKAEAEADARRDAEEAALRRVHAEEQARREAEEAARLQAEAQEQARREAEEAGRVQAEAEARARREAEEAARLKAEAEEQARREAEEAARLQAEAEARARREAEEAAWLQAEAEAQARREAEEAARLQAEAEARARREAEEAGRVQAEAEARALREAEEAARLRAESDSRTRREAEERVRREAVARAEQDAEQRRRQAAEERARRAAEEKAKREAEARARRNAEEKARRDAEEKAAREAKDRERAAAEERARREAEERARREAEERARREAEERVRREAQERARADAEAKARRDAEARLKREPEDRTRPESGERLRGEPSDPARQDAARAARSDAEPVAKAEVQEAISVVIGIPSPSRSGSDEPSHQGDAQDARPVAETDAGDDLARAVRETEERAKQLQGDQTVPPPPATIAPSADALRASVEAERRRLEELFASQAQEDATRRAIEVERVAEERRQAEARERQERLARELAARQAAAAAEERARREAETAQRLADAERERLEREVAEERQRREEAERKARDAEKQRAKERAESAARKRREERQLEKAQRHAGNVDEGVLTRGPLTLAEGAGRQSAQNGTGSGRRLPLRRILGAVALLTLVAVVLFVLFAPVDKANYERIAAQYVGQPVSIGRASLTLLPSPSLRFQDVQIGGAGQFRATDVYATPRLMSLIEGRQVFTSMEVVGASVSEKVLYDVLAGAGRGGDLSLASIEGRNITVLTDLVKLPLLQFSATINGANRMRNVKVWDAQRSMTIDIAPKDSGALEFEVASKAFPVPFGASFLLSDFGAKGRYVPGELSLSEWDARQFGGVVKGSARVKATDDSWTMDGFIEGRTLELSDIAPAMFASGRVQARGRFYMTAPSAGGLFQQPTLEASFTSNAGQFSLGDLQRLMQSSANQGGSTLFTDASGDILLGAGRLRLGNLRFTSGPVSGAGGVDIDESGRIFGRITSEMRIPGSVLRGTFGLSGTMTQPALKATGVR